jgi:hypothetical protein
MPQELPEELGKLAEEFEQMKMDAAEFLSIVSDKEFNKSPDGKKWSIAECIDHLIVTGYDYTNMFEEGLKIAVEKNLRSNGPFKYSWFAKKFISSVEPPPKLKLKAPKKWRPGSKINKRKATAAFLQLQDRWVDLINKSAGLDISEIKLPSPATKLIKFSSFEILGVNSAHQRRHLLQAKNVKNKL